MAKIKRVITVAAVAACLFSLISCARVIDSDDRPSVVVTIFPQYDFVRAIAGDSVDLTMLVSPGAESHTYDPSVADVKAICDADLFIYTGGEIDEWAKDLDEAVEGSDVMSVRIADAVEGVELHDHDHEHDHDHDHDSDEHIWTSPKNAISILDYILDALIEIAPENESLYRANAESYRDRLYAVDDEFKRISGSAGNVTFVVADRFPFEALFEEYGLSYAAALDGCAVGVEPAPAVVGELIELVNEQEISGVFYIEFSDCKVADVISAATGCGQFLLHSCHNVSRDDFEDGVTFCDLMEMNAEHMRGVLGE